MNDEIQKTLSDIAESITQREWLQITKTLDRNREEINDDFGLQLLAIAWAKDKHVGKRADWDAFLDMTDAQLLEHLGIDIDEVKDAAGLDEPAESDDA